MRLGELLNKMIRFGQKVNTFVNIDLKHEIQKQNFRDYYTFKAIEDTSCGINNNKNRDIKIIISLTTYGIRIFDVYNLSSRHFIPMQVHQPPGTGKAQPAF